MADPASTCNVLPSFELLLKDAQSAFVLRDLDGVVVEHGDSCRVIASVFELGQANKENITCLTFSAVA